MRTLVERLENRIAAMWRMRRSVAERLKEWIGRLTAWRIAALLVGMTLVIGALLQTHRPARSVVVTGTFPPPQGVIELVAMEWGPADWVAATLDTVSISRVTPDSKSRGVDEVGGIEIRIPMEPRDCREIAGELDAICGFADRSLRFHPYDLSFESKGRDARADAAMSFRQIERLRLSHTRVVGGPPALGSWSAEPVAKRTWLHLGCEGAARFWITVPGRVATGRCRPSGQQLRIGVKYPPSFAADISFSGLDVLRVEASGRNGYAAVETGMLRVAERERNLDESDEVAIETARNEVVTLGLMASPEPTGPTLRMATKRASSVRIGEDEQVPTLLASYLGYWNQVLFLFLGLLIGIGFESLRRGRHHDGEDR